VADQIETISKSLDGVIDMIDVLEEAVSGLGSEVGEVADNPDADALIAGWRRLAKRLADLTLACDELIATY
jgi:archaellum component FlaC